MTTATPNGEHRAWLRARLDHAAAALGVTTTAEPVFGWHDRSIGTRVKAADGKRWLRVVTEMSHWAGGAFWTGNLDANAINDLPKPRLLTKLDWFRSTKLVEINSTRYSRNRVRARRTASCLLGRGDGRTAPVLTVV